MKSEPSIILKKNLIDFAKSGGKCNSSDEIKIEYAIDRLYDALAISINKGIICDRNMNYDPFITQSMAIIELINNNSILFKNLGLINNDSDYYLNLIRSERVPVRKLKLFFELIIENKAGWNE